MTMRRISDAEVDAALHALVAEDEHVTLEHRVLNAIATDASAAGAGRSWLPRLAFAGGTTVALVVALVATLAHDVGLPAPPAAPAVDRPASLAALSVPAASMGLVVNETGVERVAARVDPESLPLIDALQPPRPLEIEYLHTAPLEREQLRIQPMTIEPLSIVPLDGD